MRFRFVRAAATAAALAACARPAPPATQASASQASASQASAARVGDATASPAEPRHCGLRMLGHSVRPGEDMQFLLAVPSNSQWCFDGIGLNGGSTEGQTVVRAPAHGQLRLVHQPGAVVFGYRPAPGFAGTDHFRIAVPAEIETIYFAGAVDVAAAN